MKNTDLWYFHISFLHLYSTIKGNGKYVNGNDICYSKIHMATNLSQNTPLHFKNIHHTVMITFWRSAGNPFPWASLGGTSNESSHEVWLMWRWVWMDGKDQERNFLKGLGVGYHTDLEALWRPPRNAPQPHPLSLPEALWFLGYTPLDA